MTQMIDFARSAAAFVAVLGVLVFVHELGHYLAARWRGVHVEAFSIGFGPALVSWRDRLGTVWKLSVLPLGGYVKLHGQERPEDVEPEVRAAWQDGRTFHSKSVLSRAIVVAAGPVANFLLAAVLFCGVFVVMGRPSAVLSVLSEVKPEGTAAKSGLLVGDRIDAIEGSPVTKFEDVVTRAKVSAGQTLTMQVMRDGHTITLPVEVGAVRANCKQTGQLGVGGTVVYNELGVVEAVESGFRQTWLVTVETVQGLGGILNGSKCKDDLSGPIGIAKLSGEVALRGFATLINFIAVLSINLGLVNLIPIPVLDGGHLMFFLAEAIRGRPLPPRILEYGFRTGFALLAMLFVFATWNDLSLNPLFQWVRSLIG